MKTSLEPHFFTQIGLDSGALTMLGAVVHGFAEAGEYRGTVHRGDGPEAAFVLSVDGTSAVAQATIDLAQLTDPHPKGCGCGAHHGTRFALHPRGFAVFHVSGGSGGYWVNVRRAVEDPEIHAYDSRQLHPGDIFSAVIVRPGRYALRNELSDARAEVTVNYPTMGKTAYRPPAPLEVECGKTIEPREVRLDPAQGLNVRVAEPARVRIELLEPDDGPRDRPQPRAGWKKQTLPQG